MAACGKPEPEVVQIGDPETESGAITETQEVQVVYNNGKAITDPVHGLEEGFWYGAIGGVEGVYSSGVGFTYYFADDSYLHTLNVNIKVLPKGEYYVGWLTNAQGGEPIRLGTLASLFGDSRHSIRFETKQDLEKHNYVVVTKETTKDPAAMGTKMAEGTLKRYDRPQ